MKKLIILLTLLVPASVWGQAALSPSMRIFLDDAAVNAGTGHRKSAVLTTKNAEGLVPVFLHLDGSDCRTQLEAAGVKIGTMTGELATARIPLDKIGEVAALDCVKYIEKGAPVTCKLDEANVETGVARIHAGESLPSAFRGNGVVIGLVDNGFEYGHPNFYDEAKTHLRIKRVWDQNKKEGVAPDGFSYGAEYRTEEEIIAASHDMEESSHGTHVLGIASGADRTDGHNFSGIAGEADIVLVSLNSEEMAYGDNTTVIDGMKYIYDYAESVGKPCVINLSLGSHIGPHDGTSTFDRMADALQGPGRLLVGSVGNEGKHKFHLAAHFEDSNGVDVQRVGTFVDFKYIYSEYSMVEMWGDEGMPYEFVPFVYNIAEGKVDKVYEPVTVGVDHQVTGEYKFTIADDGLAGSIRFLAEINPGNGKGHAMAIFNFFQSSEYRIGFYIGSKKDGTVHMWTDDYYSGLSNFGCEGFLDGDDACSAGEIGGTGKRIISVGAHVTRDHYTRFGIYYPSGEEQGNIASFSSKGPTADGRVKPDVSAPGSYIVSSMSSVYTGAFAKAVSVVWNGTKYPFGFMQGSSMAAPMVCGSLACWLQADPELTPEEAKEIIRNTSVTDDFTGELSSEGDNMWGYGKFDAWNGLKECLRQSGTILPVKKTEQALILSADGKTSVLFASDRQDVLLRLFSMSGMEVLRQKIGSVRSGEEYAVDTRGIPDGIYLIRLTDSVDAVSQKIIIRK